MDTLARRLWAPADLPFNERPAAVTALRPGARLTRIGTALSLCALSASADDTTVAMPEVVVTASRLPAPASPGHVVVLQGADLNGGAGTSPADLLAHVPGIDRRSRGIAGVQTDLEIMGSTYNQVLLLVDGVRVSDPQTAHHNLNLPLGIDDLDRIEIAYGAASSVHGPDAFGGVVNLVPRQQSGTAVKVAGSWGRSIDAGQEGLFGSDAAVRWGVSGERGNLWMSAGRRHSDGYRDGTDFSEERLYGRATGPLGRGRVTLSTGLQDKEFGARDFYAPYPSEEATRAWLHSAAYQLRVGGGAVTLRTHHRRHRDHFVLVADNPAAYQNRHRSQVSGAEIFAAVPAGRLVRSLAGQAGQLAIGGELTRESLESSNLGDRSRLRGAVFGEYGLSTGSWSVRLAVRFDRHQRYGWQGSPSLSLSRSVPRGRIFTTLSRAHRAPSYTELYYRDPGNEGNAHLRAESARALEAGVDLRPVAWLQLRSSLFARREAEVIDYVRAGGEALWRARNLGRMQVAGLLTQADVVWRDLRANLGYAMTHKERTLEAGLESKYVFTHPRHQLSASLTHPAVAGAGIRWQVVAVERQALEDYAALDATLGRRLGRRHRLALHISNLTDTRYEAVRGVPAPGRWLSLTLSLDM